MSSDGFVNLTIEDNIARITFFYPKSNSLPGSLLRELKSKIDFVAESNKANVIIIQSEGKTFCAGASFDELLSLQNFEDSKEFFLGFARVINAMRKSPQIIIAKVHGKTVGGGVGIVAAADYAIASSNVQIRLSELSIGIAPFVIGPAVERKIGKSAFAEMSIDTEWKSADWGVTKGLFNKVTSDNISLTEETDLLAQKLAGYNSKATAELKSALWENTDEWDLVLTARAEKSGELALSDFTREVLSKFKSK